MSDSFTTSLDLVDMPGGEAQWEATFKTAGAPLKSQRFAVAVDAEAWLERVTLEFLAERVVLDAPDGDGVVVAPHHAQRVVFTAPAVAVRVREASPMFSRPQEAAQVAERIYYATRLLDEAAEILTAGDFAGDFKSTVGITEGRLSSLMWWSACEVLEQYPVHQVGEPAATRRLAVVRDGGVA